MTHLVVIPEVVIGNPFFLETWIPAFAGMTEKIEGTPDRFKLTSDFKPTGDQPKAIEALTEGLYKNFNHQGLLGVTGSGKTFTVANVIANMNKPALVIAHNKTLRREVGRS